VYKLGVAIPSGHTLASVPQPLRDELPLEVAQTDGLRNLGDFWTTMKLAWKPALQLTVTVPVVLLQPDIEAPAVTTIIAEDRQANESATAETWLSVGGRVLAGATPEAVPGAWVQILGLQPVELQVVRRRMITDADGRFLFSRLRSGRYRLRVVASGLGDLPPRDVDLPSATGEYDLRFP
jgi:Carboxypeptidase regulatory-like domain